MVLHRWHAAAWLLGASDSRGLQRRAAARRGPRRSQAGRPRRRVVQALGRRLLPRHGRRRQARSDGDRRAQHVDRLERRQRPLLDQHDRLHLRRLRPAEGGRARTRASATTRDSRWDYFGLVNEPCFEQGGQRRSEPARSLARRSRSRAAPPIRSRTSRSIPASSSARAASRSATARRSRSDRSTATPAASSACACSRTRRSTRRRAKAWDPERYYTDPSYYNRQGPGAAVPRRHVVRLLPCRPEPDQSARRSGASQPTRTSSSSVGAQYMWVDRLFIYNSNKPEGRTNYMYQLAHTYRPGSMDTSLVSTDGINNPRTDERGLLVHGRASGWPSVSAAKLAGGELDNKQFNDFVTSGPLLDYFSRPTRPSATMHVLKDGADSVGPARRAQPRLSQHRPVQRGVAAPLQPGGRRQGHLADQDRRRAEELGLLAGDRGGYAAHRALLPEGGAARSPERRARRRAVPERRRGDASSAARSSSPTPARAATRARRRRRRRRSTPACVRRARATSTASRTTGSWTQTDEFKEQMTQGRPGARLPRRQLPLDRRPRPGDAAAHQRLQPARDQRARRQHLGQLLVAVVQELPSVGTVTLHDPFTGEPMPYQMPAGGRGYTRVPSLISLWSTAPFLLNNTRRPVRRQTRRSTARMKVFDASIEQMLWPAKRERDSVLGAKLPRDDRPHDRAERASPCRPASFRKRCSRSGARCTAGCRGSSAAARTSSSARSRKGVPVGLLANLKLRAESDDLGDKAAHVGKTGRVPDQAQARPRHRARRRQRCRTAPALRQSEGPMMELSKCKDFVVNRGHYFGTAEFNQQDGLSADERRSAPSPELSDQDKRALIAFLKTF